LQSTDFDRITIQSPGIVWGFFLPAVQSRDFLLHARIRRYDCR
jgi:hypothetical protein